MIIFNRIANVPRRIDLGDAQFRFTRVYAYSQTCMCWEVIYPVFGPIPNGAGTMV